jgi:hypothetical protein
MNLTDSFLKVAVDADRGYDRQEIIMHMVRALGCMLASFPEQDVDAWAAELKRYWKQAEVTIPRYALLEQNGPNVVGFRRTS